MDLFLNDFVATRLASAWLWAQAEGGRAAEGAPAAGAQDNSFLALLGNPMMSLPIIALLFYLMFLRPDAKRRADFKQLLEQLKKNDRVVTIGGIYGTVVNVQKGAEDVTLRIDETNNTRIRVSRTAIARIVTNESGGEADKTSD